MMWKARTLWPNPTSQVIGSTPVVIKNGMHQPGYPLVHGSERLGCVAGSEDVNAQLCLREFGQQHNGLPGAAGAGPGPGKRGRHRGSLSAADDQAQPVEGAAERQ